MKVIPYSCQSIDQSDIDKVTEVLRSEFLTQGPHIKEFEDALSRKTGALNTTLVCSGTAALHLACLALDMNKDSVGITSPISFAASANCMLYCGSKVLFADVDPTTGIIDPQSIEALLKEHSKNKGVIIPVSLNGQMPELREIQILANKYGYRTIEDAAHSIGAYQEINGIRVNSGSCKFTDLAILSFHPVKHVCAGEGGAITSNDPTLDKKIKLLRSHGIQRYPDQTDKPQWYYEQTDLGFNYRITDVCAALGNSQLNKLDTSIKQRRLLADRYREAFAKEPFNSCFSMIPDTQGHVYHLFVIHFKNEKLRNQVHADLKTLGVLTQVHYLPIYRHPYYQNITNTKQLPGAEEYFRGCLSIPLFPSMTIEQQNKVIESLEQICNNI